jgi:hypothetical protein
MVNNSLAPASFFSGGLVPQCCPTVNPLDLMPDKQDSAEGVAARIKQDEADAKKRRAAVRYLGTVDCVHHPEARDALIGALRADTNECVRFEAAMALGNGCCCNKETIKALSITVAGLNRTEDDGNPPENCERVRIAAVGALEHCLACYVEIVPVPKQTGQERPPERLPPPERPERLPAPEPNRNGSPGPLESLPAVPVPARPTSREKTSNGAPATANSSGPVVPANFYRSLKNVPMKKIVADARQILEQVTRGSMNTGGLSLREHSLTEIVRTAVMGPAPAAAPATAEPPRAVTVKPMPEKPARTATVAKPAEFHLFTWNLSGTTTAQTHPVLPTPAAAPAGAGPVIAPAVSAKTDKTVAPTLTKVDHSSPAARQVAPAPLASPTVSTFAPATPVIQSVARPVVQAPPASTPVIRTVETGPVIQVKQTTPVIVQPAPASISAPAVLTPAIQVMPGSTASVAPAPAVLTPAIQVVPKSTAPVAPAPTVLTPAIQAMPKSTVPAASVPMTQMSRPTTPVVTLPVPPPAPATRVMPVAVSSTRTNAASPAFVPAPLPAPEPMAQHEAKAPAAHGPRITLAVLLEMMHGKSADDREWAASQLAILPARSNPQAVQALLDATRDPSAGVRLASLRSLIGMHAEPNMIYAAASPLLRDPDGRVRVEAYEDLRRIGVVH